MSYVLKELGTGQWKITHVVDDEWIFIGVAPDAVTAGEMIELREAVLNVFEAREMLR